MEGFCLGISLRRRSKSPIGLDIGTNTFRVAQLRRGGERPLLINYGSIKVPLGIISEGEVMDPEAVSKTLISLWKNLNLSEKRVVIGVANQKVVARLIVLPYMQKKELKSALRYQAQDYIPIPLEEAILDFDVVGEFVSDENERMIEVLLVAARRDMIESHIEAVETAGLIPLAIDVSSLAFARSLVGDTSALAEAIGEQAVALVNISSGTTNIVVVENELPRFTRTSSIAGNTFTEVLADKLHLTFEEAENLKIKIGLPPVNSKSSGEESNGERQEVQEILLQVANEFIADLRRSLDYYLAQATRVRNIERIIVTGGAAYMTNLIEHLSAALKLTVEIGHPLRSVRLTKDLIRRGVAEDEASMAVCLGLALRGLDL
jgi:type IV pilus assembly protein PilM